MKLSLYPHNQMAYNKVRELLATKGRAAVIHPTGTGKSYIAFAVAEENPQAHILWMAPNEYIYNLQSKVLFDSQKLRYSNITFQTYPWLAKNISMIDTIDPDIIILDEFHRAGATDWGRGVSKLFERYPNAKALGLSATNVRYLDGQRDMATELFDGYVASHMSLCEAMAKGILPTPKYVVSVYQYEDRISYYQRRANGIKDPKKKELTQNTIEKLRKSLESATGLREVFAHHITEKNGRYILFCRNIPHMYEMMSLAPEWFAGVDLAPHIYCVYTENYKADQELQDFIEDDSDHLKLLFCVGMLNEGIHIAGVDGVVLLRPTISPILYKQQIGRGLSAGAKNTPVIFDLVNNFDSLFSVETFKQEWEEQRIAYLKSCKEEQEELRFEIIDELADARELLRNLIRNLETPWDTYCNALQKYTEENGKCWMPSRYRTEDGLILGKWVTRQRERYAKGKLCEEEINRLEAAGMIWTKAKEDQYHHWYELLCEYRKEHGDCIVPGDYVTENGEFLGNWVNSQRTYHRNGKLNPERKKQLDALGFCWEVTKAWWEEGYRHAQEYAREHGTLDISCKYVCDDGYQLGRWLTTQRKVYQGKASGNLDEVKIKRLEAIGMNWETQKKEDPFEKGLKAFKKYMDEINNPCIPLKYVDETGFALGTWASRQRVNHKQGKLTRKRQKVLEEAGFLFEREDGWMLKFAKAQEYYKKNGSLIIKCVDLKGENVSLNSWIRDQRKEYDKEGHGKLTEEQVKLLESIDIQTRTRSEVSWKKGYSELLAYYEVNGHIDMRFDYHSPDGFNLGSWLNNQRDKYKTGKLCREKAEKLEVLGIVWENKLALKTEVFWNKMYEEAKNYYEKHGNLQVPSKYQTESGAKLGQWIFQQRRIIRGKLKHSVIYTDDRLKMVKDIGMTW